MFRWLRRREGKRTVAVSSEPAEPIDPIAELLRFTGDDHPQANKQTGKNQFREQYARPRPPARARLTVAKTVTPKRLALAAD